MTEDEERIARLQRTLRERIEAGDPCGPFCAAVVAADGTVVSEAANGVVAANCSHAHAEMNALAAAEKALGTWNLSGRGLTLYTTAEPCLMCVGGILWSGVERVVYGVGTESVERITGFDEGFKPGWREAFAQRGIAVVGPVLPALGESVLGLYVRRRGVIYRPERQSGIAMKTSEENQAGDPAARAEELFRSGRNCAQAVFGAWAERLGMDSETAACVSSGLGGGVGRLREVCGAVTGATLALGLARGPDKDAVYAEVQALAAAFRAECGSVVCRELLAGVGASAGGASEERTAEYYRKRPCAELVRLAARLVGERLEASRGNGAQ